MTTTASSSGSSTASLRLAACLLLAAPSGACIGTPSASEGTQGTDPTQGSGGTTASTEAESTGPSTGLDASDTGVDDTGAEPVCGDGVVGAGEACDDGNATDGDGCSARCQHEPCAIEWAAHHPLGSWEWNAVTLPMALDGDDLVMAHLRGPGGPLDTGLTRASTTDGAVLSSLELSLLPDDDYAQSLALDPSGDLFLGNSDYGNGQLHVRRLSPAGKEQWVATRSNEAYPIGLRTTSRGSLVLVASRGITNEDTDAVVVGLDPASGAELWVRTLGGQTAPNGYSLDYAAGLVVDAQDRMFVLVDEYVDWDTRVPVVVALSPEPGAEPLWRAPLLDMPGRALVPWTLALGPDGLLVGLVFEESPLRSWVVGVDAETGEARWVVESAEIDGLPASELGLAVATSADRVLVTGYGRDARERLQGYVLGLDLEGGVVCTNTLGPDGELAWVPASVVGGSDGSFHVAGYRSPNTTGEVPLELLLARVH